MDEWGGMDMQGVMNEGVRMRCVADELLLVSRVWMQRQRERSAGR